MIPPRYRTLDGDEVELPLAMDRWVLVPRTLARFDPELAWTLDYDDAPAARRRGSAAGLLRRRLLVPVDALERARRGGAQPRAVLVFLLGALGASTGGLGRAGEPHRLPALVAPHRRRCCSEGDRLRDRRARSELRARRGSVVVESAPRHQRSGRQHRPDACRCRGSRCLARGRCRTCLAAATDSPTPAQLATARGGDPGPVRRSPCHRASRIRRAVRWVRSAGDLR